MLRRERLGKAVLMPIGLLWRLRVACGGVFDFLRHGLGSSWPRTSPSAVRRLLLPYC